MLYLIYFISYNQINVNRHLSFRKLTKQKISLNFTETFGFLTGYPIKNPCVIFLGINTDLVYFKIFLIFTRFCPDYLHSYDQMLNVT